MQLRSISARSRGRGYSTRVDRQTRSRGIRHTINNRQSEHEEVTASVEEHNQSSIVNIVSQPSQQARSAAYALNFILNPAASHTDGENAGTTSQTNFDLDYGFRFGDDHDEIQDTAQPGASEDRANEMDPSHVDAYGIGEPECKIAMKSDALDVLTVLKQDKVVKQGFKLKRHIAEKCTATGIAVSVEKWKKFWHYIKKTCWTSNPLERFDREMNSSFPAPHPNLPDFVVGIEILARRFANLKYDIKIRRALVPQRLPIVYGNLLLYLRHLEAMIVTPLVIMKIHPKKTSQTCFELMGEISFHHEWKALYQYQ
ncbi:hypothetical protein PC111_g13218 [Phytophthora cactorum]|nr:hypothetical protein PC111_g13218 [Phytophthora cactorum]